MKLVLTNDDGYDAPGLAALLRVAERLGDVRVVAPDQPQSGVGHTLTMEGPLRARQVAPGRHRVAGTPADCARLAVTALAPDAEWVLSGINRGGNLGSDTYTSGTVAAAREAVLLGRGGIALSQYVGGGREIDWELTIRRAAPVLESLLARASDRAAFWSVNLPRTDNGKVECEVVHCGLDCSPLDVRYTGGSDGEWIFSGDYHRRPRQSGRDVDVCMSGRIAVTRIPIDITAGLRVDPAEP